MESLFISCSFFSPFIPSPPRHPHGPAQVWSETLRPEDNQNEQAVLF
jgi:hypothetical protein